MKIIVFSLSTMKKKPNMDITCKRLQVIHEKHPKIIVDNENHRFFMSNLSKYFFIDNENLFFFMFEIVNKK